MAIFKCAHCYREMEGPTYSELASLRTELAAVKAERDRLAATVEGDNSRFAWLEAEAKRSQTGISFDWIPSVDGERSGWRFMRRFFIGQPMKNLRGAIDVARALLPEGRE